MKKYSVLFFLAVISIPVLLGVSAWQSNKCGIIRNEIKAIEKDQENCVNENRTVANEIVELLATDRVEREARKMGLQKKLPEDVILVIMGGTERGN